MIVAFVLIGVLAVLLLMWGVSQRRHFTRGEKIIEHLLKENTLLKEENIRVAIEAREKERKEIGQDMHDELGSTLLTMKMNLSLIEKLGLFIFESNEALKEVKYSLDNAIEYVKAVSRITSPTFLENFGLNSAIIQMARRINTACVAKVDFIEIGNPYELNKEKQLHIFRIIQEVINNSLRYASPWHISVALRWKENELVVEVRDDGYNYKFSEKYQSAGLGLNNIRERANLIGASFTNESLPEGNLARIHLCEESALKSKQIR